MKSLNLVENLERVTKFEYEITKSCKQGKE